MLNISYDFCLVETKPDSALFLLHGGAQTIHKVTQRQTPWSLCFCVMFFILSLKIKD